MTEELRKTIKEEIMQLPKEGQDAINALDWVGITEEIGSNHHLDGDEVNNFQLETLLVLIGIVAPEFYSINIENQVETTTDEAKSIAKESSQKIFAPIRRILEENIKKNLKNKNPGWRQSIDFILSGGDYSVFMEQRSESNNSDNQKTILPVFPIRK